MSRSVVITVLTTKDDSQNGETRGYWSLGFYCHSLDFLVTLVKTVYFVMSTEIFTWYFYKGASFVCL